MNRNPSHRAVADPLTLGLVALIALAAGVFGTSWKPLEFLRPKPPTTELTALQGQLAQAQAAAEAARLAREAAIKAERAKLEAEVRSAQEDNAGTLAAIAAAPDGPEVKLAKEMAVRVDMKLAVAVGDLPKAQREAMMKLIADALAGKDAEFRAAMAQRDAEFATLRGERDQLQAQIPVLTQKVAKAEETAKAKQQEVTVVTEQVKVIATELDAKRREAGSLGGALSSAKNVIVGTLVLLGILGAVALYLRMGLGSIGRGLQPLQQVLAPEDYAKVISSLDSETDKLHQWLVAGGRKAAHYAASKL